MNYFKGKFSGFYKLTRVGAIMEFFPMLMIVSIIVSRSQINFILFTSIIVNFVLLLIAFAINDIADAEDDALDPDKVNRNPISAKIISKEQGYVFLLILIILSLGLLILLSEYMVLIMGILILIVGLMYSLGPIRLKARPFLDLISHGFFLAGGQVIFFGLLPQSKLDSFTFLAAIGIFLFSVGGDLFNEVRDWKVDRQVGINNTASIIGYNTSNILVNLFKIIGVIMIAISIIAIVLLRK